MSPSEDINNDEYIAQLLAKEARDSSIKYSAMGMSAFLPSRPTNGAPKPNKRFLGNLLRETDSHNAALKKKEELEARMRLRGEKLQPSRTGRDRVSELEDGRERKRRRVEEPRDRSRSRDRKQRSRRSRHHLEDRFGEHDDRPRHRRHEQEEKEDEEPDHKSRRTSHRDRHHRHERRHRSQSMERSHSVERGTSKKDNRDYRRRSRSRSRSESSHESDHRSRRKSEKSKRRNSRRSRSRSPARAPSPKSTKSNKKNLSPEAISKGNRERHPSPSDSDSDPLESIVGPLPPPAKSAPGKDFPPPVISRGRGAYKTMSSTMDAHFSASYDPTMDMQPESDDDNEKDDWDMALEALRDRELWKQKGAERLRAAGFGDEEIKKWEDSGKEKGIEDVKWTSKGEAREWDRGKVIETEGDKKGEVSLEAAWKRKNGFMRDLKKALG